MNKITLTLTFIVLFACQPSNKEAVEEYPDPIVTEKLPDRIYSLMNAELPDKVFSDESRRRLEQDLNNAKLAYDEAPDSLELIIWYGRRAAYLGKYLQAINIFSDGIAKFPSSHKLRRHRGHRYITIRQFDNAISDYEMAAYLSLNVANEIEPDGIPNRLNQPLSNDKFNIWYHFGLAYYLNGRYDKALSAYTKCMEFSDNDDLIVATKYWQYLTYRKIGNNELAESLLSTIPDQIELIENESYYDLLLLYKGKMDDQKLIQKATNENGFLNPTLGYGIGSFYQHQGRMAKANETFLKVLESPNWDAFGYIASEAELTTIFPTPRSGS